MMVFSYGKNCKKGDCLPRNQQINTGLPSRSALLASPPSLTEHLSPPGIITNYLQLSAVIPKAAESPFYKLLTVFSQVFLARHTQSRPTLTTNQQFPLILAGTGGSVTVAKAEETLFLSNNQGVDDR